MKSIRVSFDKIIYNHIFDIIWRELDSSVGSTLWWFVDDNTWGLVNTSANDSVRGNIYPS